MLLALEICIFPIWICGMWAGGRAAERDSLDVVYLIRCHHVPSTDCTKCAEQLDGQSTHSYGKISKVTHKPKISVCSSSYWLGLMPNGDQTTIFTSQMWKWRAKRSVAMLYVRHAKWDRERNAKKERNEIGVKWIALGDKYHSLQIIIIIIIPKASCAQSAHARECSIAQILNKYTRGPSRRPPQLRPVSLVTGCGSVADSLKLSKSHSR